LRPLKAAYLPAIVVMVRWRWRLVAIVVMVVMMLGIDPLNRLHDSCMAPNEGQHSNAGQKNSF